MMRLDYLPDKQIYVWRGPFEKRNVPIGAGFQWNSELKRYITTNPMIAARTGLSGQEVALATRKLNMSAASEKAALSPSMNTFAKCSGARLLPYQQIPYEYAKHDRFHLLADDTGLGKTVEALSFAMNDPIKNHLIICPANKREDWQNELYKWTGRRSHIIYDRASQFPVLEKKPTFIISFALLYNALSFLQNYRFDHLIIDEVQALKSAEAVRTMAALDISDNCGRVTALSATFPPNYPSELWPVLNKFAPATIDHLNYNRFLHTYCQVTQREGKYTPVGFRNTADLSERLRSTCMTRRRYRWVHTQTPKPIIKLIQFKPNDLWKKFIKEETPYELDYVDAGDVRKIPMSDYAKLRNQMSAAKVPLVAKYARQKLETEQKILILGWHKVFIRGLAEELAEFNPVIVHGGISPKKKFEAKERFQTDETYRVFIGNIQSAGIGIDLTAARYLLLGEASWVPGDNHQAIGRIDRYGQVRQVTVDIIVVRGTLDAKVLSTAMTKQEGLDKLLDTRKELDAWQE